MQQNVADHQIEIAVFERRFLGIHLREVDLLPHRGGAGVGVADNGRANVDAPHLRIGEKFLIGHSRVAHGAAHVEYAARAEPRHIAL